MARRYRTTITFVISLALLASVLPHPAEAWVSRRDKQAPSYKVPFQPQWVTRVKRGKLIKYRPLEFATPVAFGERIFVGADSGYLYALSLKDGDVLWRFKATGPVHATPALAEDRLYFGDHDGRFYALSVADGRELWRQSFPAPIMSQPLVLPDKIILVTLTGTLMAVGREDGSILWSYPTGSLREMTLYGQGAPAYESGQNLLYVGLHDGRILAVEAQRGALRWEKTLAGAAGPFTDIDMQPLLSAGKLYVATHSGKLYCLESRSGQVLWSQDVGSSADFAMAEDRLYVAGSDGVLYALNKVDGKILWSQPLGEGALSKPLLYGELVALASTERSILFVDAHNGHFIMQRFARKNISSDPILAGAEGNLLVYLSNAGRIYALKLKKDFRIE